jgi:hypothetical protein
MSIEGAVFIVQIGGGWATVGLPVGYDFGTRSAGFDRDHMFEFFAGRNHRHRSATFGDQWDEDDAFGDYGAVTLEQVFPLPKNMKLYYQFDFGDNWYFEIRRVSHETQGADAPHPVSESGRSDRPKSASVRPVLIRGHFLPDRGQDAPQCLTDLEGRGSIGVG